MLAVTVDIEDWYHIPAVTGSPFATYRTVDDFLRRWTTRYDYLTKPTYEALDLLADLGVRATFFVVADVVDNYPGLVESIAEQGHEIACHGLHHACIMHPSTGDPLFNEQIFEERTAEAKSKLEKASGQEVIGFRTPNAFVAGWMLDSLEKLGFAYDSSVAVNSLYAKMPSKPKDVTTVPYYPVRGGLGKGEPRGILEIPWPFWHLFGIRLPTAGGPFLRFFGAWYIAEGIGQSLQRGDTIFYFHPIDISTERFPSGFSLNRPFYWSIKGKPVKRRIRRLLQKFQHCLGTCRDILEKVEFQKQT